MSATKEGSLEGKTAPVTGITGQDGSYLAEFLLSKGYKVHGLMRRNASEEGANLANLNPEVLAQLTLHNGDMLDATSLTNTIRDSQSDEVYNLAAQSHVTNSFRTPDYTFQINLLCVLKIYEAIVACGLQSRTRVFRASFSEMFGSVASGELDEDCRLDPQSPYAISKLAAYHLVRNYYISYSIYGMNAISFNHESPRRGRRFVTMRVANYVARYALRQHRREPLTLAGLEMQRDWGHARDYVKAMWMMLQAPAPQDLILATGQTHSITELVERAFEVIGVTVRWLTRDFNTEGIDNGTETTIIKLDTRLERPAEVARLLGNNRRARESLGWDPETTFEEIVQEMVLSEIAKLRPLSPSSLEAR